MGQDGRSQGRAGAVQLVRGGEDRLAVGGDAAQVHLQHRGKGTQVQHLPLLISDRAKHMEISKVVLFKNIFFIRDFLIGLRHSSRTSTKN